MEDLKNNKKRKFKMHFLFKKQDTFFSIFLVFLYYYKIEKSYFYLFIKSSLVQEFQSFFDSRFDIIIIRCNIINFFDIINTENHSRYFTNCIYI